jgi:hypothetical protein
MIAWGVGCSSWDDSVDFANLRAFDDEEIPDDAFVMTTWHEAEPLSETLWFAKHSAFHPTVDLRHTLLVHISRSAREHELLAALNEA